MELLFAVFPAFLAIFVHVFAVVFFLLQLWWFQFVHGDAQQQKEKSVILPLFWAARPGPGSVSREGDGSPQRRFDLPLAAKPEKMWRIGQKISPTTL